MFNLRLINQVRIKIPCDPPATYIQDSMVIHDFYRAMVNVSIELDQDLILDRLIVNIRVSMTSKVYAKNTNKRHHLVTL